MHPRTPVTLLLALLIAGGAALAPAPAAAQSPRGQRNLFEAGLFLGGFFPAARHELYDVGGGTHRDFEAGAFDIGLRVGYMPFCFAGIELEGAVMPTRTRDDVGATVYAVRAHALFQVPAHVSPFIVLGGGLMGVKSDTLGSDTDASFNFGAGLKWYVNPSLVLRLDGRGSVGGELGSGGRTVHFELLAGASWVMGWSEARER